MQVCIFTVILPLLDSSVKNLDRKWKGTVNNNNPGTQKNIFLVYYRTDCEHSNWAWCIKTQYVVICKLFVLLNLIKMIAAVEEILSSKKKTQNPHMVQFPVRIMKVVEINSYFSTIYI